MAYGTGSGLECTAPLAGYQMQAWQAAMGGQGPEGDASDQLASPLYSTDDFRMYCFKVTPCDKMFSHDWTLCPFAHPGEKARRRDPQRANYAAIACIDMKKNGTCPRGDGCPYAHNVFEYWMHPTRYRTQLCKDGPACNRSICFFAHSIDELRVPPHKPGFPPECRRRRHGRGSRTAGNSVPVLAGGKAPGGVPALPWAGLSGLAQTPLARRAMSVPAPMAGEAGGVERIQMSDGSWGSPIRRAPGAGWSEQMVPPPASCPSPPDPLCSSPITPLSPTIWSPRPPASPFTHGLAGQPGGPTDERRWSLDSAPLTQRGDEDVARVLLQLMGSLSLTPQQAGGASGEVTGLAASARSRSLDSQVTALRLAAVRRALGAQSARTSADDLPPAWRGAPNRDPQPAILGAGLAGMGDPRTDCEFDSGPVSRGLAAPFPAMSRDVSRSAEVAMESWGGSGEAGADAWGAYGLAHQVSGVSL